LLTVEEFEKLQVMLGKPGGVRRRRRKQWPYTGLITCDTCGGAVVMEEKWQRICSQCKHKFVITPGRNACPQCEWPVGKMTTDLLHYVYLHCGKSKRLPGRTKCPERAIRLEQFEKQVDALLAQIEIPDTFAKWLIKWLKKLHTQDAQEHKHSLRIVQQKYNQTTDTMKNLAIMRANNELDANEYRLAKHSLMQDKRRFKQKLDELDQHVDNWLEKVEQLFDFAEHARTWFANGTNEQKRVVLQSLGSNLTLSGKKLRIEALKPFVILKEIKQSDEYEKISFELAKKPEVSLDLLPPLTDFPKMLASSDAIRTYFLNENIKFCVYAYS
jgi:hypothetical protein